MSSPTASNTPVPGTAAQDFHFKYTVLKGYFMQSEDETDDVGFDFKTRHFGLITRTYPSTTPDDPGQEPTPETQWSRLTSHLHALNTTAPPNTTYKLLFLARHGQGYHNAAETTYGTSAWNSTYSRLDGADGKIWADAHLTPLGQQQALAAHSLWASELARGIPAPEKYYTSPLTRALQTADLTFTDLKLPAGSTPYIPVVKERLREVMGVHTCDRRSPASSIAAAFPHAVFEPGFAEADTLWDAEVREPRAARRERVRVLLDEVFTGRETVVSFTSHCGLIASLMEVVGHRIWGLETGGVVPVLVRAEREVVVEH
ncbi:putative phosphoglycerate mutase pmu1 [Ascochyta clinopodiicola]|nr:putative phosphoglycerate mutase pmu1 [Ascochyta clinopodiicola]